MAALQRRGDEAIEHGDPSSEILNILDTYW